MNSFEELCGYLDSSKTEDDTDSFESESLIIIDWKEDIDEICSLILPEDGRFSFTSEADSQTIIKDGIPHKVDFFEGCYHQWEVLKALDEVLKPEYVLMEYAPYKGCDCWGLICVTAQEYDTLLDKYGKELYKYFIPGVFDNVRDFDNRQNELIYGKSDMTEKPAKKTIREKLAAFLSKNSKG